MLFTLIDKWVGLGLLFPLIDKWVGLGVICFD